MSKVVMPLLFLILPSAAVFADVPAWILLEQGRAAYERSDLTASMEYLLDAVETDGEYPEAEYWLGRVYEAQGQPVLAEDQYRKSLELSIFLRVPDERFTVEYALINLLLNRGSDRRLEVETLLRGIADAEGASSPKIIELEHRFIRTLIDSGPDELLYLYRDELEVSLPAWRMLGEMAWEDRNYRTSLLCAVRTVLSMLTTVSDRYRASRPEWRFDIDSLRDAEQPDRDVRYPGPADGTADLVERVLVEDAQAATWLAEAGFWPQLYLLGTSLYAEGHSQAAREVWRIMAPESFLGPQGREEAGPWGRLAVSQLEEPFITVETLTP